MRPLLNCWLVALRLWKQSRGRALIWMRRSLHFKGVIPHSGTMHHAGWRQVRMVEYIPYHAKVWSRDNLVFLFRGRYRVWDLRVVGRKSFETREEMEAYLGSKK